MNVNEWASTDVGKQYLSKMYGGAGAPSSSVGAGGMGGGMPGVPTNDYYSQLLKSLFEANSQNPTFQKSVLAQYIDYVNPANYQSRYQDMLAQQMEEQQRQREIKDQFLTEAYELRRRRNPENLAAGETRQPVDLSYQYLMDKAKNWGLGYSNQDLWRLLGNS